MRCYSLLGNPKLTADSPGLSGFHDCDLAQLGSQFPKLTATHVQNVNSPGFHSIDKKVFGERGSNLHVHGERSWCAGVFGTQKRRGLWEVPATNLDMSVTCLKMFPSADSGAREVALPELLRIVREEIHLTPHFTLVQVTEKSNRGTPDFGIRNTGFFGRKTLRHLGGRLKAEV